MTPIRELEGQLNYAVREADRLANELANLENRYNDAVEERDRLRAIVAALPRTADGVPVVPGMEVWKEWRGRLERNVVMPPMVSIGSVYMDATVCYSTREAAEAAKGATP